MTHAMTAMPKYERYKDSGFQWIREIPEHWEVEKGKWLFKKESRPVQPDDEVITCFRDGQVTLRKNRRADGFTNAVQEIGYQRICEGDLVIHAMDAFAGAVGVSDSNGKSSPVYSACTPLKSDSVDPFYYAYFLRDLALSGVIVSLAKGIRERSTDFRFNDFGALQLSVPPLEEQIRIVEFLDKKIAQIDEAIGIKEQQITLLKERKQIIIQNAVTKGLNPNAPMKDSGVDWISDIPEHWEILRLRFVIKGKLQYGANESGVDYSPDLPRYIRITDFSGEGRLSDKTKLSLPKEIASDYLLADGDILFARSGATVGKAYQFKSNLSNERDYAFAGYLIKARPNEDIILSDYLYTYTSSQCFSEWKNVIFNKATIENIGADKYANLFIAVPPLSEQQFILDDIENDLAVIDDAINLQQAQIDNLKEYKASLINSAVTGKIKVI